MPLLKITEPHTLGKEEAVHRLRQKEIEIKEKNTYLVSDLSETWTTPYSMDFAFKIYGFSPTGSVCVEDDKVTISVDLPLAAMFIQGMLENEIRKELAKVLA
ncbi:MAG: polyhydroxyalkanoic acid system family protein [Planctomycetaceae bacterium]|nr:polyhydroxyalkanoic acid system family protein [Planctomycetaceae bacterium]